MIVQQHSACNLANTSDNKEYIDAGDVDVTNINRGCVQAVSRAVAILNCLAENRHGLSLTAIVKDTSLAPSTAHRLLTTLQGERFVQFEPEALRWLIGAQAFTVGVAFTQARRGLASRELKSAAF